jgi:3-oxoacyl-[acyl-carrier-protein] synthase-3
MAEVVVKNVGIDGIVTVVPKEVSYFSDDAERLGIDRSQALRIKDSVGLKQRYTAPANTTALDLGEVACEKLLKGLDQKYEDIGFLIFVTQSPDHRQPCNAAILHGRLNLDNSVGAFDINLGCSGYVYGLYIASTMIASLGKKVLLVVGDTLSKEVNPMDRSASILFGDAASATLLSSRVSGDMYFDLASDGAGYHSIIIPAGGARQPCTDQTGENVEDEEGNIRSLNDLKMVGGEVFNFAVRTEPKAIKKLLEFSGKSVDQIDYFFFHQANKYILKTIAKRLKIPATKVPDSIISNYGNQSSASIPCAINVIMNAGEKKMAVLSGFGVGLSWASVYCELNLNYCPEPIIWSK